MYIIFFHREITSLKGRDPVVIPKNINCTKGIESVFNRKFKIGKQISKYVSFCDDWILLGFQKISLSF